MKTFVSCRLQTPCLWDRGYFPYLSTRQEALQRKNDPQAMAVCMKEVLLREALIKESKKEEKEHCGIWCRVFGSSWVLLIE